MPQTARHRTGRRAAPVRLPTMGSIGEQASALLDSVTQRFEGLQRQLQEATAGIRERAQEAAEQAGERAGAAGELARKLAYASVGLVVAAQEELDRRVAARS